MVYTQPTITVRYSRSVLAKRTSEKVGRVRDDGEKRSLPVASCLEERARASRDLVSVPSN